MKQYIDFYKSLPQKEKIILPTSRILEIGAVFIIASVLFYGHAFFKHRALTKKIAKIEIEKKAAVKKAAELVEATPKVLEVQAKEKEIVDLTQEFEQKKRLADILQEKSSTETRGFSKFLRNFSNQIVPDVWLTKIEIKKGGEYFALNGKSYKTSAVSIFMKNINSDPMFAGQEFSAITLNQDKDNKDLLNFTLLTSKKGERYE